MIHSSVDIVVPSAKPESLVRRTLPALADAVEHAGLERASVSIMDEVPERAIAEFIEKTCGFRRLRTGGVGAGPARNAGASRGSAPWLLFVDDDVELDLRSVGAVLEGTMNGDDTAVVGGLRPPADAPSWLIWVYADATLTPASALAPDGPLPPVGLAAALLLIRRDAFEVAGGFPDIPGIEDSLLGLALSQGCGRQVRIRRDSNFAGVHHYTPTWDEWLARSTQTGQQLRTTVPSLDADTAARLLHAHSLGSDLRGRTKRATAVLPPWLWSPPRGRLHARLAAASAEARGFRVPASR